MISRERMRAVDRNAVALGVSERVLMEVAGRSVADVVTDTGDPDDRIGIVCGQGNNGGDGFVVPRYLDPDYVQVFLIGDPSGITGDAAFANWDALQAAGYSCTAVTAMSDLDLTSFDTLIDGLCGTGIDGPLRDPAATVVERINEQAASVVAIDVPSGFDIGAETDHGLSVEADHVVTFHETKPGLESLDATVHVADIGIPPAAESHVGPGDLRGLDRAPDSHKGAGGSVLIVGGGPYTGAPAFAGLAALRMGADLVTVAAPETVVDTIQGYAPDLLTHGLPGDQLTETHVETVLGLAAEVDTIVLGPGLGDASSTMDAVTDILTGFDGRGVIDADALAVVESTRTEATLVCTPHLAEFERMGGRRPVSSTDRAAAVSELASRIDHTIVLKGRVDVVADGTDTRRNRTGNPGMTVGGTGDVLAGVISTLLADEGRSPLQAGAVGAYVTGLAGDRAATDRGSGLLASDVLESIPAVVWGENDD